MGWNTLLLALREIRRNLLRSFLTVLGIVIGVSAVITMVTLGNGAKKAVSDQISSLGSNLLLLLPGQRTGAGPGATSTPTYFRLADADAIREQISILNAVAPLASSSATLVNGSKSWFSNIIGTDISYLAAANWRLADGRYFNESEARAGKAVCVLGATVRSELFGQQNPIGSELRVKKFSCTVIGTLMAKGQGGMGRDQDDLVVMPLLTVQRRLKGNTDIDTILLSRKAGASSEKVIQQVQELMRERRKISKDDADNFSLVDTKEIAQTLSVAIGTITDLLGAVAAVSLLVGGVGIMNIMLVSVTERTREIGIRLAIGALEHEVLLQFLIEAVTLSVLGGLIGVSVAALICYLGASLMHIPFLFHPGINALAVVFSAVIGIIFGYVPAKRAAGLDPIQALRHE